MATEALNQHLRETHPEPPGIESFEFEEVFFDRILVVPDHDRGVETFLTLTQRDLRTNSSACLYQFHIDSISTTEDRKNQTTHVTGLVKISRGYDLKSKFLIDEESSLILIHHRSPGPILPSKRGYTVLKSRT